MSKTFRVVDAAGNKVWRTSETLRLSDSVLETYDHDV